MTELEIPLMQRDTGDADGYTDAELIEKDIARFIEERDAATKRAEQAEADARELVDYADKAIIAEGVDFSSRKMERITALIEKYAK